MKIEIELDSEEMQTLKAALAFSLNSETRRGVGDGRISRVHVQRQLRTWCNRSMLGSLP